MYKNKFQCFSLKALNSVLPQTDCRISISNSLSHFDLLICCLIPYVLSSLGLHQNAYHKGSTGLCEWNNPGLLVRTEVLCTSWAVNLKKSLALVSFWDGGETTTEVGFAVEEMYKCDLEMWSVERTRMQTRSLWISRWNCSVNSTGRQFDF
jgi:hypothetical protein